MNSILKDFSQPSKFVNYYKGYNMKKNICKLTVMLLVLCTLLSGCKNSTSDSKSENCSYSEVASSEIAEKEDSYSYSEDVFAMDTYMTLTAYGKNSKKAVKSAIDEINRLDKVLSTGNENSEVYKVNKNSEGKIGLDFQYLLERADEINKLTNGKFNIAIYPLMQEWGFTNEKYHVPTPQKIKALLSKIDPNKLLFNKKNNKVYFEAEDMAIDFGGIAKGYTSARIMDIFREYEIQSGMVSLGGNVQVYGTKTDGSNWKVGIKDPFENQDYVGILEVSNMAVITSGGYERYFKENGKIYHHIIDPDTGFPAESGLKSVTIVSCDGTLADALSTSLFIMGEQKAEEFWREHRKEFDAVMVKDDGTIYVTEGLENSFKCEKQFEVIN